MKTKIKLLFDSGVARPPPGPITKLPQELVEEILSYFIDDIRTLLACSVTCRSWYIGAVRHLHYSLTTYDDSLAPREEKLRWPGPLKQNYELGLLPCVKRLRIRLWRRDVGFAFERLDEPNLRYFSALKNLRELGIDDLQVSSFMPNLKRCFGHLSPTLRFLSLRRPRGRSREIVYFIGLFPHLQDLKLHYGVLRNEEENIADTTLVPLCSPPLQGRLTLTFFTREQIVKDMITLFGGLRFHLFGVKCLPLLFEKCAETLETLKLYPTDPYSEVFFCEGGEMDSRWRSVAKVLSFDLSQNKTLRTFETTAESIRYAKDAAPGFLKTVLSSVIYPGMLDVVIIHRDCDFGGWTGCPICRPDPICFRHHIGPTLKYGPALECLPRQLGVFREMYDTRRFRLVFCVDIYGCVEDLGVRVLRSAVKEAEVNGQFECLACKPVITCEGRSLRTHPEDRRAGTSGDFVPASAL